MYDGSAFARIGVARHERMEKVDSGLDEQSERFVRMIFRKNNSEPNDVSCVRRDAFRALDNVVLGARVRAQPVANVSIVAGDCKPAGVRLPCRPRLLNLPKLTRSSISRHHSPLPRTRRATRCFLMSAKAAACCSDAEGDWGACAAAYSTEYRYCFSK